jgi:hypothetical protein
MNTQTVLIAIQTLVFAATALFAWHQVREARRLREESNRPFVVMDFEPYESDAVILNISNVGNSLARNVRFKFTPQMESQILDDFPRMKMFREGIATLAPGKTILVLFDSAVERQASALPDRHIAEISYQDQQLRRQFVEEVELDLGIYWDLATVARKDLHDVHARLEEIQRIFDGWTSSDGRLKTLAKTDADSRRGSGQ